MIYSNETRIVRMARDSHVATVALVMALATGGLFAQAGYAADVPAPAPAAKDAAVAAPEIVVTGSRISRRDFQSESPISTVSASSLAASGQPSLDRAIGELPQFAAAQGAAEVGDAQGAAGSLTGGQSFSDLRGLGPNRALVLLDGRRLMPSAPDGSIDLNTIPTSLIDTVEVITGGASATYGSDAVAGVVNFKLRQKFTGIELNVQHGGATKGDGATNQISGIIGGAFADARGHAMLAFEYSDRATVEGSSRPFFANIRQLARPPEGIIGSNNFGGGLPTIAAVNAVLAGYPGTTPIAGTGTYRGAIGVNTDGSIFTTGASPNCAQNFKGVGTVKGVNISPSCTTVQVALGQYFAVQVPLTKYNVFAKADYEIADHVTLYGQFNFLESKAVDQTSPASSKPAIPLLVPQNSPYVTGNPGLSAILASISPAPTGNIIVTKLLTAFPNRVETYKYDVWQATVGVKGDIPGTHLKYDVYGSFGRSQLNDTDQGDISFTAINTILNGTANASGCTGFAWNPFGNNPLSAGCLAYAGRTDHNINTQTLKTVEGTIEGALFRLPAGELRFAVGADYRETNFDYQPDSTLSSAPTLTPRVNGVTSDSLAYGLVTAASGTQRVSEVFGELLVPLLKNQPFVEDLSLDLGYRYSHYNEAGNASTWKADLSWMPIKGLRFRGGYSTAFRAPSLQDAHGATTTNNTAISDPCTAGSSFRSGANATQVLALCTAQGIPSAILPGFVAGISAPVTNGSNPTLTPEKSKSWSVGAVIAPKVNNALFRNFQVSVDYYNIKLSQAIGTLGLTDILPRCFNSDGLSNPTYSVSNPYCARIQRETAGGQIVSSQAGLFNFGTFTVAGVDTQINWRFGLDALGASPKAGKLEFNSIISYLKDYKVSGLLGSPTLNYAGSTGIGGPTNDISHPTWKASTNLTYSNGPFSLTGRWRYIDKLIHTDVVANPAATTAGVPAYSYFDLDAHYVINKHFSIGAGVTNLADKGPPFITGAQLTTDAALYDVIGRRWFASIKAKF